MRSEFLKVALLGTAACVASSPVWAQDKSDIEEVTVSASRLNLSGYSQPTPVTSVGTADLEREAQTSLGDVFRQLPSFSVDSSPDTSTSQQSVSGGNAGADTVDLRGLGATRTLVMYNNTRVVQADPGGGVDLSLFPSDLIKRVDVVTGGASAAWGSDAVAGVVNIVMDNNFDGVKGNLEGGTNQWVDTTKIKGSLAVGTSFFADKLHVVADISYLNNMGTPLPSDTPWDNWTALIANPAYTATNGQVQYQTKRGVGLATATQGGLITSGPLKGIQFLGPNATPSPFNFGTVSGILSSGGSALTSDHEGQENALGFPERVVNFYGNATYKLFDSVKATVELEYGRVKGQNAGYSYISQDTIKSDNAYLPASIVSAMAANHITTFVLGTTNTNNILPDGNPNVAAYSPILGELQDFQRRAMHRGVFRLDGTVFDDWSWSANVQHSEIHRLVLANMLQIANYNNAVDAVAVSAANVGASGLPIGSVQCRSTLTAPTNGCQPLDVFGDGVASQAAMNYIKGGLGTEFTDLKLNEDTASFSFQGQPFSLWAGPTAIVAGFDYRKESVNQNSDPISQARGWLAGNAPIFVAHYYTEEGFAEFDAPLLKNQFVESLDFTAAGRLTSYSTSGLVETWKIGATSQVNDDVKLRLTWSTDIRAPSLTELFNPGQTSNGTVAVPGQATNANGLSGGNPNLNPEVALAITGGAVLTPHWIPGLTLSADWYSINLKGVISSVPAAQIVAGCQAGIAVYCAQYVLVPGKGGGPAYTGGVFVQNVKTSPVNGSSQTVSGLDFQADYSTDFWHGTLTNNITANYTDEAVITQSGPLAQIYDNAGSLNQDTGGSGRPKLQGKVSVEYDQLPYSFTVQSRFRGSAHVNNLFTQGGGGPFSVDDNSVPWVGYLDIRGSYQWNENFQFYGSIDNLMDIPPPEIPSYIGLTSRADYGIPTRSDIYDVNGRMFRVGVRMQY